MVGAHATVADERLVECAQPPPNPLPSTESLIYIPFNPVPPQQHSLDLSPRVVEAAEQQHAVLERLQPKVTTRTPSRPVTNAIPTVLWLHYVPHSHAPSALEPYPYHVTSHARRPQSPRTCSTMRCPDRAEGPPLAGKQSHSHVVRSSRHRSCGGGRRGSEESKVQMWQCG